MGDTKQLPPAVDRERISGRPYDSAFARLPADETVRGLEPGGGLSGTVSSGRLNWPLVTIVVGFALVFVTPGVQHWLPLVAGLALMVAGAVWAAARNAPLRLSRGVGTVTVARGSDPARR